MIKELVKFRDSDHTYRSKSKQFQSVSRKFSKFKEEFEPEFSSIRSAFKKLYPELWAKSKKVYHYSDPRINSYMIRKISSKEEMKKILEEASNLKEDWSNKGVIGRDNGTEIHTNFEDEDLKRGWSINPYTGSKLEVIPNKKGKGFDNISKDVDLFNLRDGYHPELLIHSYKYLTAGQSDRVWIETIKDKRYVFIDDWKTDKKIEIVPEFFDRTYGYKMFKGELSHMFATNYWTYAVKISMYAKMMEDFGFKIGGLRFTNTPYDEELNVTDRIVYELPYKDFEAFIVLKS